MRIATYWVALVFGFVGASVGLYFESLPMVAIPGSLALIGLYEIGRYRGHGPLLTRAQGAAITTCWAGLFAAIHFVVEGQLGLAPLIVAALAGVYFVWIVAGRSSRRG